MKYEAHKKPVHHEMHKHGSDAIDVSDHNHSMHRGPHHDKYIHAENRHGEHALGDSNHIKSVMGEPKGNDVTGHHGKMHW